jgi:hypothetical protein
MANKMECPACKSYTSAILEAYVGGRPCPYCGLPQEAASAVLEAQKRGADEDLTKRMLDAEKRAAKAEHEAAELRSILRDARGAVAREPRLWEEAVKDQW